jgi:uroporphyrinogen decarboxylase
VLFRSVQTWLEAAALLKRHFRNEVFIRGNCDQSPFSLAGLVRGPADWMMDLMDENRAALAHRLLEHCAEATLQFLRLMAGTGVHMVSNGDSPAGPDLVSPDLYRRFALPYERRVAAEARRLKLPYVLHICGDTTRILDDMLSTGADGLELDYKTDAVRAHAAMKDRAVFIGNIDPSGVLTAGTPATVEAKARELIALFADTPLFILNAGCAIPPTAPAENIRALVRAARTPRDA